MKTFKIICTETHIHEFYVDAKNEIEAQKSLNKVVNKVNLISLMDI